MSDERDYSGSGYTVQHALREAATPETRNRREPPRLLWGGQRISNALWFDIPRKGTIELKLLTYVEEPFQGVDLLMPGGGIRLQDGSLIELLRTWCSSDLPDVVRYPYESPDGRVCTYNVFCCGYDANDEPIAEKWLPNAAVMLIRSEPTILIRASDGVDDALSFDDLSYEIVIQGDE